MDRSPAAWAPSVERVRWYPRGRGRFAQCPLECRKTAEEHLRLIPPEPGPIADQERVSPVVLVTRLREELRDDGPLRYVDNPTDIEPKREGSSFLVRRRGSWSCVSKRPKKSCGRSVSEYPAIQRSTRSSRLTSWRFDFVRTTSRSCSRRRTTLEAVPRLTPAASAILRAEPLRRSWSTRRAKTKRKPGARSLRGRRHGGGVGAPPRGRRTHRPDPRSSCPPGRRS